MPERRLFTAVALAVAMAAGCASTGGGQNAEARAVYADAQCGRSEGTPAAIWAADAERFAELFRQTRRQVVDDTREPPQVDFTENGVLLILMGQKPTGGYSVSLLDRPLEVDGDTARLSVHWRQPPADAVVTQALTSPCLAVALPRDAFQRVVVADQHGDTRVQLNLSD